eukprot:gene9190-1276_t
MQNLLVRRNSKLIQFKKYLRNRWKLFQRNKEFEAENKFEEIYRKSLDYPEMYWREAAQDINWIKEPTKILDDSNAPFYRWFKDGVLNTCYNALDRHVENGNGEKHAIIYDSPTTQTIEWFTYGQVLNEVQRLAGVLKSYGVQKGDIVMIYMPNIPQAIFSMLACSRIGAIHNVVFGGYAATELASRIEDSTPVFMITCSFGSDALKFINYKEIVDEAREISTIKSIKKVLVYQRKEIQVELKNDDDLDWKEELEKAAPFVNCVALKSEDPLYILYTSGTTGKPKGVVRDNGGHAVAMCWTMKFMYDIRPDDIYWSGSNIGWIIGHSFMVYGPLLIGCTTVIFEGSATIPDAGVFWRVIRDHGVNSFFTVPSAIRAIKRDDPHGRLIHKYDISSLRNIWVAGERCDFYTLEWIGQLLKIPILDHYGQCETAWGIIAPCLGINKDTKIILGSCNKPVPGFDVRILKTDENDDPEEESEIQEVEAYEMGNIVIKLPLPPGTLLTLYKNDERFIAGYFHKYKGYYFTGDAGYKDEFGNFFVMSRCDDIIKNATQKLSASSMEEILQCHPDVAEATVIGALDVIKTQTPIGFIVLKSDTTTPVEQIKSECIDLVKEKLGPLADFNKVVVVSRLPKNKSGKIIRNVMRKIADDEEFQVPPTIDVPEALNEIKDSLKQVGYPLKSFFIPDDSHRHHPKLSPS